MLTLLGIFVGLIVCIAILMAVLPFYAAADIFVNKPGPGLKRSGFHLFTKIAPGQVKIIVRGKKPVRMVMNTSGKVFARNSVKVNATENDPEYWELKDGSDSKYSEDPTEDIFPPIRWWAKKVYAATGAVFTGVYPFQRVYEYEIERTVIRRKESEGKESEGKDNSKPESGGITPSNIVLEVKRDYSDHFRTRQFLFPMHITAAETRDKIPLDIIGVSEMEVTNPHKAAFGTDRWDHALINLVTDKITGETKKMSLDNALTATNDADTQQVANAVASIKDDEAKCGIQVTAFRILEINPALDNEGLKAIQAEAIAIQKAKATRIDGQARADSLRSINEANQAGGDAAIATMEAEALVRAAEAASKNGGSVILMPSNGKSGGTDPIQTAILAELRKLNKPQGRRN